MSKNSHKQDSVEIWGGIECSVVRIKNRFYDQLKKSKHDLRPEDLELFHDLGIKTIRFPILWEKVYNPKTARLDFSYVDKRVELLLKLGLTAIAGLSHHGSGPFFTCLNNPNFPFQLAEYAHAVALRYPFIKLFTPINEPLTNARFAGLYGIWYPHSKDSKTFIQILINQIKGIILSMKTIREVIPDAGLVQTEDLGKVYSTDILKYQADFENVRRWLTYDMLTGKFDKDHEMYNFFRSEGIEEKNLAFFEQNYCIPDICGFNHYVTSERFLDHHYKHYPKRYHGGNGKHFYADVEAVRVNSVQNYGLEVLIKEAWNRYKLPIALSEVHLSCTREEQIRWFYEAFNTSNKLRKQEIDIRSLTAWALLGSYDWDSLMLRRKNHYETGIYDLTGGKPRPTGLAKLIKEINNGKQANNPVIKLPGWWKRDIRIQYFPSDKETKQTKETSYFNNNVQPILITGASGSLGIALIKMCHLRGLPVVIPNHAELDITDRREVENAVEKYKPFAIINAAGFSKIDQSELNADLCFKKNTIGPAILADVCRVSKIKFVTFSSDQVFNGKKNTPYIENDKTAPINIYGKSKEMAEDTVLQKYPESLIIRSSYFFNPWNPADFLVNLIHSHIYTKHYLPGDIIISPTYVPNMVNKALDLLIDDEKGIWHLSDESEISISEFVKKAFLKAGLDQRRIISVNSTKLNFVAARPKYSVLQSLYGQKTVKLDVTINNFFIELKNIMLKNDPCQYQYNKSLL